MHSDTLGTTQPSEGTRMRSRCACVRVCIRVYVRARVRVCWSGAGPPTYRCHVGRYSDRHVRGQRDTRATPRGVKHLSPGRSLRRPRPASDSVPGPHPRPYHGRTCIVRHTGRQHRNTRVVASHASRPVGGCQTLSLCSHLGTTERSWQRVWTSPGTARCH